MHAVYANTHSHHRPKIRRRHRIAQNEKLSPLWIVRRVCVYSFAIGYYVMVVSCVSPLYAKRKKNEEQKSEIKALHLFYVQATDSLSIL